MTQTPDEPTDEELLDRSLSGDETAFDRLFYRHQHVVRTTCGALLAWSEERPDVAQDVWLTAWRRRASFNNRSAFKTWLIGIVIQTCRNQRRSRWRQRKPLSAPNELTQRHEHDGHDSLELDERHEAVRAAVARLTLSIREVAVLYYLNEMSSREIAEQLGITSNTVDKRLQRAREQLRTLLDSTRHDS